MMGFYVMLFKGQNAQESIKCGLDGDVIILRSKKLHSDHSYGYSGKV